jgi:hypothetical protein
MFQTVGGPSKGAAARKGARFPGGAVSLLLSPVVERELRVALHRRDARKSRLKVAGMGVAGVTIFMLLIGGLLGSRLWGSTMHFYLFIAGLYLAVGPAIQISTGLFAEERRQQTLELLYLTGMGSGELFIGKLLGGALVASSDLLALVPLMAIPFMSGGLSFDLFLATAACLPTVFVFVLAVGALGSALCKDEGTAFVVSLVLAGVLCLALPLPYNMGLWVARKAPFTKSWLCLSPALGPWLVYDKFKGFGAAGVRDFWRCTAFTWGLSMACLGLAAVILKQNWRRDLERSGTGGLEAKWAAFVRGSAAWREALRKRLLPVNAYQWLVEQDRRPVLQAWGLMAVVVVLWLLAWCAWPSVWPSTVNFLTTALVMLIGMGFLMRYAAARQIASDRREGAFELLLTTLLSPEEVVEGQEAALREQFRPAQWAMCGLFLVMAFTGLMMRNWTGTAVLSYLAVWGVLLTWCREQMHRSAPLAMWVAANSGRPMFGLMRVQGSSWGNLWMAYWSWSVMRTFAIFGRSASSFPTGSPLELVIVLFMLFAVLLSAISQQKRNEQKQRLISQLRSIAQEPVPEKNDPRFKIWKVQPWTRFPAPPGTTFDQPEKHLMHGWVWDHRSGRWTGPEKEVRALGGGFWRAIGRRSGFAWRQLRRLARPSASRQTRRDDVGLK